MQKLVLFCLGIRHMCVFFSRDFAIFRFCDFAIFFFSLPWLAEKVGLDNYFEKIVCWFVLQTQRQFLLYVLKAAKHSYYWKGFAATKTYNFNCLFVFETNKQTIFQNSFSNPKIKNAKSQNRKIARFF